LADHRATFALGSSNAYNKNTVRRSWAILLLAVFSFSLIAPAVFAGADTKLPACCARGGKHHCNPMSTADTHGSPSGTVFQAARQQCVYYPKGGAVPVHSYAALRESSQAFFASIQSHPAVHAQTEARYRISFNRSRQKRGPPVLPC
jgi:hypothetical protein